MMGLDISNTNIAASHVPVEYLEMLVTILAAFAMSSGFWLFIDKRKSKQDARDALLIGLAHDRIMFLGILYLKRGFISQDEYENLHTFLYTPYKTMGGNGTAKRIMEEVEKLPIHSDGLFEREKNGRNA